MTHLGDDWTDIGVLTGGSVNPGFSEPVEEPLAAADVQLTVGHEQLRRADIPPTLTEPCECCGAPVLLADPIDMARQLCGLDRRPQSRQAWMEVHHHHQRYLIHLRNHTAERCQRARAGDPEPVDFDINLDLED